MLQGVFIVSNVIAVNLPEEELARRVNVSANDPMLASLGVHDQYVLGSLTSYDNNSFFKVMAEQVRYDNPLETVARTTISDPFEDGAGHQDDYFRYWHGWQLLVDLCFFFGGLRLLQGVVVLLSVASMSLLFFGLRRHLCIISSLMFVLLAFFSTNIFGNFMGDVTLSISIFSTCAVASTVLYIDASREQGERFKVFWVCMVAGTVFNFFDFFTIPAYMIALVMFCALLALGDYQNSLSKTIFSLIKSGGFFVLGYLFTWGSKWLLTCFFLDPFEVMSNVAGEMAMWTSADTFETDRQTYQQIYNMMPWVASVLGSLYFAVANSPAGIVGVAATLCCVIVAIVVRMRFQKTRAYVPSRLWRLCTPAAAVPVCLAIMVSHTAWHLLVFPCKNWSIVMAIIAAVCLQYVVNVKNTIENNLKSVEHSAESSGEYLLST